MQSPSLGAAAYPGLMAVAARSATDMYAVGFDMPSVNGGVQQGLILHGTTSSGTTTLKWSVDTDPTTGTYSPLYGATALPNGSVWAVGVNSSNQGLVLQNG